MTRRIPLFLLLLLSFSLAAAQSGGGYSQLRITRFPSFPAVVADGVSYDLEGYIHNVGNDPSPATLNIFMQVNQQAPLLLLNNLVLASPIQPGDSAYFSIPGYTFATAMFDGGTQNDILIWPTSPSSNPQSNVKSDTLALETYYATMAAFRVYPDQVTGLQGGFDLAYSEKYSFKIPVRNEGTAANSGPVRLMLNMGSGKPIELQQEAGAIQPGETHLFALTDFRVSDYYPWLPLNNDMMPQMHIWAQETKEAEPVERLNLQVFRSVVAVPDPAPEGFSLSPNPAADRIFLNAPAQLQQQVTAVTVYDLMGQRVFSTDHLPESLDVQHLAAGNYLLHVEAGESSFRTSFIKE